MKKQTLIAVLTLLLYMVGTKAFAYDYAIDNDGVTIYYDCINEAELRVTYGNSSFLIGNSYQGNVNIPAFVEIDGNLLPVTSIGKQAFYQCPNLTSVTIGEKVANIGESAFTYCTSLTSVTIPGNVTNIDKNAFFYCTGLTSLVISDGVKTIGQEAFIGCSNLNTVFMGNGLRSIGEKAFYQCNGLKKVIVKDLAAWCKISFYSGYSSPLFYAKHIYSDENTEITNLSIPDGVTNIGGYAFCQCGSLTSISIPNSVVSIGRSAFSECNSITTISIPNSVKDIASYVFYGCTGLVSMNIPSSVTSIGEFAFYNCSNLKKVIVEDLSAWCGISFADNEFANPLSITQHLYSDENTEITSLVIPEGVTSISERVFKGCSGITSVTIPNSVKSIGKEAFYDCSLVSVISLIENPEPIEDAFWATLTIYIPKNTENLYRSTNGWKNSFLYYIESGTLIDVPFPTETIATYCPVVGIDFNNNSDIAAYKASIDDTTVNLTRVYQVAAGEGVLLRSLNEGVGSMKLPINIEVVKNEDNAFVGTLKEINLQETEGNINNYVLSKKNDVIGFYKANNTKVAAGKAYLPIENYNESNMVLMLSFGDATGISEIDNKQSATDDAIYTLGGVRVKNPTKGIYIINGKKVVIK